MNCDKPFVKDGKAFGCGQCLPCRINKRRIWTHRLILESTQHDHSTFVTLTYDDAHYPRDHCLCRRHGQLFLKRLRKRYPSKLRYFLVGEYGETTGRPHYHLALFNYPSCANIQSKYDKRGDLKCCVHCHLISSAWGKGRIQLAPLEPDSMAYVCGYVVKKLTAESDDRLEGRTPEYATMSRRPGLGHDAMHDLADVLMKRDLDKMLTDVPNVLQHGTKTLPLGSYLQKKLRTMVGKDEKAPKETLDKIEAKMSPLREAAFNNSRPFKEAILEASLGKRIQIEARQKRQRKKDRL